MAGKNSRFRSQFDYDVEAASNEATIPPDQIGESLTIQSQSEDADINVMMARFGITGKMPDNPRVPTFGDFTGISDYATALRALNDAQDMFMEFTPQVRERFGNNPQRLMEFMEDVNNRDEAVKLGLINPRISPQPKAAEKISEAVAVPPAPSVP